MCGANYPHRTSESYYGAAGRVEVDTGTQGGGEWREKSRGNAKNWYGKLAVFWVPHLRNVTIRVHFWVGGCGRVQNAFQPPESTPGPICWMRVTMTMPRVPITRSAPADGFRIERSMLQVGGKLKIASMFCFLSIAWREYIRIKCLSFGDLAILILKTCLNISRNLRSSELQPVKVEVWHRNPTNPLISVQYPMVFHQKMSPKWETMIFFGIFFHVE